MVIAYAERRCDINMDTDVLIVYPPLHRLYGERKQWMPLGILYLASYLNEHGINAVAYNADCSLTEPECIMTYENRFAYAKNYYDNLIGDNEIWDEIKSVIIDTQPQILGISVLTESLGSAKKLIELARAELPDVVIVAGGAHAEIDPDFLISALHVDYVIKGDGEATLYNLARDVLKLKNKPELQPCQSIIEAERVDLLSLPFPKLEYHYKYYDYKKVGKKLNISTSRGGCVYSCKFCYCSKFKYSLEFRQPKSVVDEIEYCVRNYDTKKFFFVDDTFTLRRQYVIDICQLIISSSLDISWTCTTRASQVDNELLTIMKLAGCKSIHIGVESGSERILEFVDKRINISDVEKASALIKQSKIECRLFFLVGLPTESSTDLLSSINLMKRIQPDETIINMYVPIPKTELYDYICNNNCPIDQIDWLTFSRDKVPYLSYVNNSDGKYEDALLSFFRLADEMNQKNRKG